MSVILKYRSVVGLGEFAGALTRFARRLRTLMAWLSVPANCAFVIVTRPARCRDWRPSVFSARLDGFMFRFSRSSPTP